MATTMSLFALIKIEENDMEKFPSTHTTVDFAAATENSWFRTYGTEEMRDLLLAPCQSPEDEIRNLDELSWALVRLPGPIFNMRHTTPEFAFEAAADWDFFLEGKGAFEEFLAEAARKLPSWLVEETLTDSDGCWVGSSIWHRQEVPAQ
jgi:hypothetical protein